MNAFACIPEFNNESFIQNVLNVTFPCAIKNPQSVFVAANLPLAQLVGFNSADEMIGITDAELRCDAAQYAKKFQEHVNRLLPDLNIACEGTGYGPIRSIGSGTVIELHRDNPSLSFIMFCDVERFRFCDTSVCALLTNHSMSI